MKKIKYKIIFIIVFCVILLFPIIAKFIDIKNDLFGVEYEAQLKDFNINNLMDFSFQDSLDDYITQKLPGKALLARARNQILYSLFKVSSNYSLNITNKNNIVFDETMDYFNHGLHFVDDEYIDTFFDKLTKLNDLLRTKNADLVLFITPTKSRYVDRDDVYVDNFISNNTTFVRNEEDLPYNKLINRLKKSNIKSFDCIEYIENHNRSLFEQDVPLYYNTSHHWSNAVGNKVGIEFLDYVSKNTKVKFSKLTQELIETTEPMFPDSDIYDLCNVLINPKNKYFLSDIKISNNSHTQSNIIIRGGSYLGQIPLVLGMNDDNSNVIFMSNTDVFTDNWKTNSTFNDYNQLDLNKYTDGLDLVILEINEVNVYNATFGFLDYLLDNKDKLFN